MRPRQKIWASTACAMSAALALFSLSCAQTIHSQVSSFTELPRRPSGLTYAIMPLKEQRQSSEFKRYEERVRAHLAAHGFVPEELARAEFVVAMAYAVDDDGEVMASYPIIGQSGSSSSRMSGTTRAYTNTTSYSASTGYTPFFQAAAQAEDEADKTKSDTQRVLRLDIVRKASIGRGRIQKVYEGEVLSEGSSGDLPEIVPAMIEALFESFPGEDGAVRHVASKSVPSIAEINEETDQCSKDDCKSEPSRTSSSRAEGLDPSVSPGTATVRQCGPDRSGKLTCSSKATRLASD